LSVAVALRLVRARLLGFDEAFEPSHHFHHVSRRGCMPSRDPNSAALNPLSIHRATRTAHSSRVARPIVASAPKAYDDHLTTSGTRLDERIPFVAFLIF
jgi:hypothetical protein